MIPYTDLKTYCDNACITYQEFGGVVGLPWFTLYRIITGRTANPSKRTRRVLDRWIKRNRKKILAALGREGEAAA